MKKLDPADFNAAREFRLQVRLCLFCAKTSNRASFREGERAVIPFQLRQSAEDYTSTRNYSCYFPESQEMMVTLEKEEKLDKLEETFQNVKEDYHRILGLVTK